MGDAVWQLVIGAIIIGIIFMLARPGSPAAQGIAQVSNALASLITTTTQYKAGNS
jgi:Na+-transporting NADH:ubiquinone oxidoreductase subunit NqrB